ncbi:hypothetical protein ES703_48930 [subsurface metagenome]
MKKTERKHRERPDFSTRPGHHRHPRHRDHGPHHPGELPVDPLGSPRGSPATSRRPDPRNHTTPTTRTRPLISGSPDQLRKLRPAQYLVVPRARSGTGNHNILVSRLARENLPAGRAHTRPRTYLRPPLSREIPPNSPSSSSGRRRKNKEKIRDS